jgi:hypothetical protein
MRRGQGRDVVAHDDVRIDIDDLSDVGRKDVGQEQPEVGRERDISACIEVGIFVRLEVVEVSRRAASIHDLPEPAEVFLSDIVMDDMQNQVVGAVAVQ